MRYKHVNEQFHYSLELLGKRPKGNILKDLNGKIGRDKTMKSRDNLGTLFMRNMAARPPNTLMAATDIAAR